MYVRPKLTFVSFFYVFFAPSPYESGVKLTNFVFSWQGGDFLGEKSVAPFSTLKMRNCQKRLVHVYAYTHS